MAEAVRQHIGTFIGLIVNWALSVLGEARHNMIPVDYRVLHQAYNQVSWEIVEQINWRVRSRVHNQVGFDQDLAGIRWLIDDQVEDVVM